MQVLRIFGRIARSLKHSGIGKTGLEENAAPAGIIPFAAAAGEGQWRIAEIIWVKIPHAS